MKKIFIVIALTVVAFVACDSTIKDEVTGFPVLSGPYLGMTPPGDEPEIFAPGIVSSVFWEHSGAVFTPDGQELFFSRAINEGRRPRLVTSLHMKQVNGVWTRPELAPFVKTTYTHINSISPDGKRLYYFVSKNEEEERAWVVDKTEDGWGEPRVLILNDADKSGVDVNEVHEARSGNLYFDGPLGGKLDKIKIVSSKLVDGKYQEPESLGTNVNYPSDAMFHDFNLAVDPDEKFIVFVSRRPGGINPQDIYISYRQADDSWGPAINLGPKINTPGVWNSWPQLSPDGKYLFFTSRVKPFTAADIEENKYTYAELEGFQKSIINGWANIYWVDTSFVEKLKPADK